ncbi:hypothetical protein [Actinoplanes subglobosus]|uniref:Uncharacterized protein n=1 Tax=Actinoplanes subglobosus TaxID=1547892 RepID=A0ABV8J0A3_9ACTN
MLKALLAAWEVPAPDEIVRSQASVEVRYVRSGVRRTLGLWAGRPGQLGWDVWAADEELNGLAPGGWKFMARLRVKGEVGGTADSDPEQLCRGEYPWPLAGEALDSRLVDEGRKFVEPMLWFFEDRADLGRLLLARDPHKPWWLGPEFADNTGSWQRGEIFAQPVSGTSAGVVLAVILARHTGDEELERLAMNNLSDMADHIVDGTGLAFRTVVGSYAEEFQEWSSVDLSDLAQLAPKRRRRRATTT